MTVADAAVIIGAGQAGVTLATSLRERGWAGSIHLVGDEDRLPYQRPPLSKGYVLGSESERDLVLGSTAAFVRDDIDYRPGRTVEFLDTAARLARLDDGTEFPYTAAVFATGATPRALSLPGADLQGVHVLRTIADADALRASLAAARHVVIVGGGFLGLEVATAAAEHAEVTVVEGLERILLRAVSAPIAARLRALHEARGVRILTGAGIDGIDGTERVESVRLRDGATIRADLVLVAIGADPNTDVAERSGVPVDGGIVVDASLRSAVADVYAIGDCARYPNAFLGGPARLESVQNATDQARFVAGLLLGERVGTYQALPWFWSHQAGANLQIAGLALPGDDTIVAEDDGRGLIVHRYREGALVAVETIDNPRAHVRARRSLTAVPA